MDKNDDSESNNVFITKERSVISVGTHESIIETDGSCLIAFQFFL